MTSLHTIDLNLLVALDLLLEEASVRGAAQRAHVTPSAMSHTLARLRVLLDDEVLVRAGRGLVPTPRASELAGPVRELLASARTLLTPPARFDAARLQRRFRAVCTDHVSTVLLGPADAVLRREAPGVDLQVAPLVPDTMQDLRKGTVDLAIGVFPEAPPELRMRRLFSDRFVTVGRRHHPLLQGDALTMEAFLSASHALVAPRGTPEGHVDRALEQRGLQRHIARAFPSFLMALWHAVHSDDLLTVSARLVAATSGVLPLDVAEPPLPLEPYTLMLAWHPRVDKAPEDAWLRGVLVRVAGELGELPQPA